MGLDMYAYATDERFDTPVDFEPTRHTLIHQWRKHPDLHGWMRNLYRAKGGAYDDFNCRAVPLSIMDVDMLEQAIRQRKLPTTSGFFFGQSTALAEVIEDDLAFVDKARTAIANGQTIIYAAWW